MRPGFLKSSYLGAAALIAAAAGMAGQASDAEAAFMLELSDGITTETVTDGGMGDIAAAAGRIRYAGGIGNFVINLTTGQSKPVLGSADMPELSLASVDVSSGTGGTFTIKLTDTDFDTPDGLTQWVTTVEGATTGTLAFDVYVGADNAEFSLGHLVGSVGPENGFIDEVDEFLTLNPSGAFSVTLVATLTHGFGWQATGFKAHVTDPPSPMPVSEPRALALFGIGLLGMGAVLLRRRRLDQAPLPK